ncbi:MAG: hypothetical protein DWQ37_11325 [Planctomycetota bacterium]|nr:MAG: hypothetical protein DWQ37_11325 [Planctomycetota bacterium]
MVRPIVIHFASALLLAGLGAQTAFAEQASSQREDDASQPAAVVEMTDQLHYQPDKVTIQAGETVLWKNEPSTIAHTVTAVRKLAKNPDNVALPEGADEFNSEKMEAGDTFTHTFQVPGTYRYFCIPHERAGMVGEVVVEPADAQQDDEAADKHPSTAEQDGDTSSSGEETGAGTSDEGDTLVLGMHSPPRPPDYRDATGLKKFLYWVGNFHPPGSDLPVGAAVVAFVSELLFLVTGRALFAAATRVSVWVAGLSAAGVAIGGWCLAGFRFDDPNWMLETHRWWGTGTALGMLVLVGIAEVAYRKQSDAARWTFRLGLLAGVIALGVTGYFGGAMIYGIDHFAWPG